MLLTVLNDTEHIEDKPDVQTLLNGLNEAQLRQIIANIVAENPRLAADVEYEVASLHRTSPASSPTGDRPPTPSLYVDIDAIRRDMRRSFRKAVSGGRGDGGRRGYYNDAYEEFYIDAGAILEPAIQAAEALLNHDDPAGATTLLSGVIEEWEEYLNLAQAEGQLVLYLTKLVELGEIERTVAEANAVLSDPGEVLLIAGLLDAQGHHTEALNVAAHGLDST